MDWRENGRKEDARECEKCVRERDSVRLVS